MKDRSIPAYFLEFEAGVYEKTSRVGGACHEESKRGGASEMVFVEKLQKIKEKAVLIWLSNGSIQVNFPDCCILLQNEANKSVPFSQASSNTDSTSATKF